MKKLLSALLTVLFVFSAIVPVAFAASSDTAEFIFDSESACTPLTFGDEETILVGDLNLDNKINSRDIIKLKKLTVNGEAFDTRLADFDYNGSINAKDSLFLKQTVSGKRDPVNKTYGNAEAVPFDESQRSAKLEVNDIDADGIDVTFKTGDIDVSSYPFAIITYMTPYSEAEKNSEAAAESAIGTKDDLVSYDLTTDGKYHSAIVDLSEINDWNGSKVIFRFFTAANAGDTLYLDSIVLASTKAIADEAALARETAKSGFGIFDEPAPDTLGEKMGDSYIIRFDSEEKMKYVSVFKDSTFEYDKEKNALKATTTNKYNSALYIDLSEEGLSADDYSHLVYVYNIPEETKDGSKAQVYYVCGDIDTPTSGYQCNVFSCTQGNEFLTQIVDLSLKDNWTGDVTGMRIDYLKSSNAGDVCYIDSIIFCKNAGDANTAATQILEERYGKKEIDTPTLWNNYRLYYANENNNEYISGSGSNAAMYFRFSTDSSKFTARSLGDRMARAIYNATGEEVTCEVYGDFAALKNSFASSSQPSGYIRYVLTHNGESYIVWINTVIIKDASYTDVLDGTPADKDPADIQEGTWGVTATEPVSLPASTASLSFHSNHEVRLVSTPYGDFAVLPMWENANTWGSIGGAKFSLFRIYDDGSSKELGSWDFAYHTSKPNIFYNKNDGLVYVVCTDDQGNYMSNLTLYFDPSKEPYDIQGGRTNVYYQGGAAPGGYGYIQPILDETNNMIYALACGGKDSGYFAWAIYNMEYQEWEATSYSTVLDTYRHCYVYGYPDGKYGFYVVAGRDVLLSTLGLEGKVTGADYAWDELNLFHFTNAYSTNYTRTAVIPADYTQTDRTLYPSACNNHCGDTYLTTDGKLHVLGAKAMHGSNHHDGKYDEMWHAVYDVSKPGMKPLEIYNYPINLGYIGIGYSMRMAESTDGDLYIIGMPKGGQSRIEIWKAADGSGFTFECIGCKTLKDGNKPMTSVIAANNRNGSVIDGTLGCFYPINVNGKYIYKYFTVTLD